MKYPVPGIALVGGAHPTKQDFLCTFVVEINLSAHAPTMSCNPCWMQDAGCRMQPASG